MYTIKLSHGYVDEPETATVKMLGRYETLDEACEAARSKFVELRYRLEDTCEVCFGELSASISLDEYYVTYGDIDPELGYGGYTYYYLVKVVER